MDQIQCNRLTAAKHLAVLLALLTLSACGGGSSSQDANTDSGAETPDNPAETPSGFSTGTGDPTDPNDPNFDYEEVDPESLPLNLAPLEPVVSRPADVSADNQAPFFENLTDQIVFVGQEMNIILAARDPDGGVAGQFIDQLPPDFEYRDNLDGTRSLKWLPLQPDVGVFSITITAVDPIAPLLRTNHTIRIQAILPEDLSTIPNLPPALGGLDDYVVRAGDSVVLLVRAVDPNGTFGPIAAIDPPAQSTFLPHPVEEDISILRWTTAPSDIGTVTLSFRATDAIDPTLTHDLSTTIRLTTESEFAVAGPTLRSLADAQGLLIGYASSFDWVNRPDADLYADIATREFNIVSTENSVKWGVVNPEPGQFEWDDADSVVALAKANDMVVHGHPLVWHRQLPKWVQKLPLTERSGEMLAFIRTVASRYNNDIEIWDVVNEALEDDGSFRQSVWFEAMGDDYIRRAFNQARLYAPTAQLLYNDYDVAWENPKSDAMYALVQDLIAEGIPLDGVGFQMHFYADYNEFASTVSNLERFAALGLDIYITELDVGIKDGQTELQQAAVYEQIVSICTAIPRCKAIQTWGFTDRYSWRKIDEPLLFDREYQPKPAYFAIREELLR